MIKLKKEELWAIPLVLLLISLFYKIIGCPIEYMTGIPCPGCGMSRALFCLLRLDFVGAWHFHPLVYAMPGILVLYLFWYRKQKNRIQHLALFVLAMVFVIVYGIRMILQDPVLTPHVETGLVFKLFHILQPLIRESHLAALLP